MHRVPDQRTWEERQTVIVEDISQYLITESYSLSNGEINVVDKM